MVRFGIVGFGLHAVKRLMPGFELSKNCTVTAISRRDGEKARESAHRYRIPNYFTSTAELCRCPDVDAVLVTTPNVAHLDDVLTAVAAGKPILCEKPMGMNAAECRQMVEAARKANVRLGIAHVFRFEESVRRLRERVAAGQIGTPVFVRSEFSFMGGREHARTWLNDAKIAGGGPIVDIGVHCIDTLAFILQDEVIRVSASAIANRQVANIESAAILTLEFARGTLGAVMCSFLLDYRTPLELEGTAGVLRADDCFTSEKPVTIELHRPSHAAETETVSNRMAFALQFDAFADAVEGKAEFPISGERGWQNQEILDAAYRSIHTGKTQEVPRVMG